MKEIDAKKAQTDKALHDKKNEDNRQFAALWHRALLAIIEIHHATMHFINNIVEQAKISEQQRLKQEIDELALGESLENYSKAMTSARENNNNPIQPNNTNILKSLLDSIRTKIQELHTQLTKIDQKISAAQIKLKMVNHQLANAIIAFFNPNNPNIQIRLPNNMANLMQLLNINNQANPALPNNNLNQLYLNFAQQFANQIMAGNVQLHNMKPAAAQAAQNHIANHLQPNAAAMPDIANQINLLGNQFAAQLTRDMSKDSTISQLITNAVHIEREIQNHQLEYQEVKKNIALLETLERKLTSFANNPAETSRITNSLLSSAQDIYTNITHRPSSASAAALSALNDSEQSIQRIENIKNQVTTPPTNESSPPKPKDATEQIQQIAVTHTNLLSEQTDKLLTNDNTINPPRQGEPHAFK